MYVNEPSQWDPLDSRRNKGVRIARGEHSKLFQSRFFAEANGLPHFCKNAHQNNQNFN